MESMDPGEREADPQTQFVCDLDSEIKRYNDVGTEVIIVGDTNINYHKHEPIHRKWNETMRNCNMVNWMQQLWPNKINNLHTCKNGKSKSWIDHVWLPAAQVREGILKRAGVEQVGGFHASDNSLIAAELNW